jgi:hypothetical protein
MRKLSTFLALLFCCFSVAFAQSGQKKKAVKPASKSAVVSVEKPSVSGDAKAGPKAKARMILRDYIKMISGDATYMNNVVFLGDGFALDYNPVDEKVQEMIKAAASINDQRSIADIIVNVLPKPVLIEGDNGKTASHYHATLQQFFADNSGILEQLGEKFALAFEDQKSFEESIFMALQSGYYTKF